MAWPTTGAGTLASGYLATGVTTIIWGTELYMTKMGSVSATANSLGIVTSATERALVDNIKLPQGDGLTNSRIQIFDGVQWDLTVRDDSRLTVRPKVGNSVTITDGGGLFGSSAGAGGSPSTFVAIVVDVSYETALKSPAEFRLTVENLILFTEAETSTT